MKINFFEYDTEKKKKFLGTAATDKILPLCDTIIRYQHITDFILFLEYNKMPLAYLLQELYEARWDSQYIIMAIEKGAPLYTKNIISNSGQGLSIYKNNESFDLLYEVCKGDDIKLAKYFIKNFDIDKFKEFPFFKFMSYEDSLSDAMDLLVKHTNGLKIVSHEKTILEYANISNPAPKKIVKL